MMTTPPHAGIIALAAGALVACASTNRREWLGVPASTPVSLPALAPSVAGGNGDRAEPPPLAAPSAEPESAPSPKPVGRFADRRANEALDRLAPLVVVAEQRRGKVITLLSDELGEPGQWALGSMGHLKLNEIAPALREQEGRTIVVQGYTDSNGTAALNEALSLLRAQAVCDYLVGQGVAVEALRAEGLGARRPVQGNGTPEGRAHNRRIEIVISR
jgi:outer membrane protein OmpA-like peptidoglycan-associated protein